MLLTHSELEEAESMKFYCNDDILIYKVLLQVFSSDFYNDPVKWLLNFGLVLLFPHNIPGSEGGAVTGIKITVNDRRN